MTSTPDPPPPAPQDEDEAREAAARAQFGATLQAFEGGAPGAAPRRAVPARARAPRIRPGARVRGRVVSVSGDSLLLDIGGRSEGVADAREFRNEDGTLAVEPGQELELFVIEAGEQVVLARTARGKTRGSLETVRQARANEVPVRGKVTAVNTGGLNVDVEGVRAFCPMSQIDTSHVEDPSGLVGRVLEFLVTEVDETRHRVVVSRRRLLQREKEEHARERLATLAPGQELDGTVTRLEPFGAFVDLGGLEGLVHVSEISHARIEHPRDALAAGEKVHVKVLRVEPGRDGRPRVALSVRAVAPDPWTTAAARFQPGMRVPGVVVRIADFGAFVNLAPGVDGLVHVSQASDHRVQHVREVLSPGQAVEAVVLAVEPERRRISLSLKEAPDEPVTRSRVRRAHDERPARRERRASAEPETPAAPKPAPDSPTTMQLAFRRAREEAERRKQR